MTELYAGRFVDYRDSAGRRRYLHVFVDIELETSQRAGMTIDHEPIAAGYTVLSITAVGYRHRDKSDGGQRGGQAIELIRKLADGPLYLKRKRIADVWERWHLNNMRAGCAHQPPGRYPDVPDCEVSGYKHGSAWLIERLPDDVVSYVLDLIEPKEGEA